MPVKFTQTYKTYEDAAAEARRAQAMADMLQQQAYQPIQMDTAGPVSYTQGLAKILQSYLAGKEGRKAREAEVESKRLGREEFKDYISAFEPERVTTPTEMAMAPRSLQQRMELKPQNLDLGQIAQGMGTPTISEQGAMGYTPPTGKLPSAGPMEFTTGALTPAQRRAKILEGMGSGNPMVQAVAQAEYSKPSMLGKIGDVAPDKFTPASLAQYQATGNAAVLVPVERESKKPSAVQEYEYAKDQGFKGSFENWQTNQRRAGATTLNMGAPVAGVDEQDNPVFFQPSKAGGAPAIVPGVRPTPKGMTQEQGKVAGFADRVQASNSVLSSPPADLMTAKVADALPGGNFMLDAPQQQFLQAERDFINAMLRRESGAAIAPSEFESARKQYIPQPGDRPETLEQKRLARERAFSGLARELGPTYKPASQPSAPATGGWGKAEVVK